MQVQNHPENAYAVPIVEPLALAQNNRELLEQIQRLMNQNNLLGQSNNMKIQAVEALKVNEKQLVRRVSKLKKGFFCKLAKVAAVVAIVAVVIILL